jgi:enoyl-CoA hydratase/carnithine racemase
MAYETLTTELDADGILVATLNRPEKMNAFTVTMANELEDLFRSVNGRDEVRAVILTGAGKAFCAGMDLRVEGNVFGLDESLQPTLADLHDRRDDPVIHKGVRDTGGRVSLAIFDCLKPVIGAINGVAVGVGSTMLLAMDARIASDKARFGFVFNKIGIAPEACSTWLLPRIVGVSKALEWVYSAEILSAEDAHAAGLVREVVAPDDLLPAARALARKFTTGRSSVAIALTRQMLLRNSAFADPYEAHAVESLAAFYCSLADGKEGVAAFLDKRQAEFSTRVSTDMPPFYPWWK